VRGRLPAALLLLAAVIFALVVRPGSPGARMTGVIDRYLGSISSGDVEAAHGLLTDSLGSLLLPGYMAGMPGSGTDGGIELVHWEARGFVAYVRLAGGGSRTLWLAKQDGGWRISGDSSLDNLLGTAASVCRTYAESTVVPAVRAGGDAGTFACPVTGCGYVLEEGSTLLCPAGHLGEGLDVTGGRCAALRDSLAGVVALFVSEGAGMPSSFEEMYRESGGRFGQPGGFRCPDHGYSYYTIENGAVRCPWHGESTPIPTGTS